MKAAQIVQNHLSWMNERYNLKEIIKINKIRFLNILEETIFIFEMTIKIYVPIDSVCSLYCLYAYAFVT